MCTARTPLYRTYRTLWGLSILLPLMMIPVSTTNAEDPTSGARPAPSSPAPKGYRDFRLGMTRAVAWETIQRLHGTINDNGWLTIPSYTEDNIERLYLSFSDGLNAWRLMREHSGPLYADAVTHDIHVLMKTLPRPIGDFPKPFFAAFGPPSYDWRQVPVWQYYSTIDSALANTPSFPFVAFNETFTHQWLWPPPDDVSAWLDITVPAHEDGLFLKQEFWAEFIIERGIHTLEEEKKRDRHARTVERKHASQAVVSGLLGTSNDQINTEEAPHTGHFFGAAVVGKRLIGLTGHHVASHLISPTESLTTHPFAVSWKEWRCFVDSLPSSARIPGELWQEADFKRKELFVPAVPRNKARLLRLLHNNETSTVFYSDPRTGGFGKPPITLHQYPLHFLDRLLHTKPDTVICVVHSRDFPVTKDALLAWSLGKTSLPQFEIVEIASAQKKPRPHPGLEALAKVSGGRYRIWVTVGQPLVTVVEPE